MISTITSSVTYAITLRNATIHERSMSDSCWRHAQRSSASTLYEIPHTHQKVHLLLSRHAIQWSSSALLFYKSKKYLHQTERIDRRCPLQYHARPKYGKRLDKSKHSPPENPKDPLAYLVPDTTTATR